MKQQNLLQFACETADLAGQYLQSQWHNKRIIHTKEMGDWVTDDDFAVQKLITNHIQTHFPSHGFMTEETDSSLPEATEWNWIIDPIDGTSNYSRHQPNFSISIALNFKNQTEIGVIYDPIRQEMFAVQRGFPPTLNGQPICINPTPSLRKAIFAFDWSRGTVTRQKTFTYLQFLLPQVHTIRNIGSAALALAWVSAGRLDGYFSFALHPWDIAAGRLLVEEAGGVFVTSPPSVDEPIPNGCWATNPKFLPKL